MVAIIAIGRRTFTDHGIRCFNWISWKAGCFAARYSANACDATKSVTAKTPASDADASWWTVRMRATLDIELDAQRARKADVPEFGKKWQSVSWVARGVRHRIRSTYWPDPA